MIPSAASDRAIPQSKTVVVALDHHFVRVGYEVYTDLAFGEAYWSSYLDVFDRVVVLARVGRAESVSDTMFRADCPGVEFVDLPDYCGPSGLLRNLRSVMRAVRRVSALDAAFILRSGSVSTCLWLWLRCRRKPYAREVQGFVGVSIREATRVTHRFSGPVLAALSERLTRAQLRGAAAASYVSQACQNRYPTAHRDQEFVFSSVRLSADLISEPPEGSRFRSPPIRIVTVGRLECEKGHSVLLDALARLRSLGAPPVEAVLIGDGNAGEALKHQAIRLGLDESVHFAGAVQHGPRLFEMLDAAHLYVLPSLTEGMPRSLIEAMARGLPAIASRVGGVPEILDEAQLVEAGDPQALAEAILAKINDPGRLAADSRRNFELAVSRYSIEQMRGRMHAFWRATITSTEAKAA